MGLTNPNEEKCIGNADCVNKLYWIDDNTTPVDVNQDFMPYMHFDDARSCCRMSRRGSHGPSAMDYTCDDLKINALCEKQCGGTIFAVLETVKAFISFKEVDPMIVLLCNAKRSTKRHFQGSLVQFKAESKITKVITRVDNYKNHLHQTLLHLVLEVLEVAEPRLCKGIIYFQHVGDCFNPLRRRQVNK